MLSGRGADGFFEDSWTGLFTVGIYLEMRDSSIIGVNVVPGSPARKAESGDLLIAVDGSPVTHLPRKRLLP